MPSTENLAADGPLPVISMSLSKGPDIAVSVDYFGPLPVTPRGNTYFLLFTDRFSRRPDMFAVIAAEFTAEGRANLLINRYIPGWGFPRRIPSDNALQVCSKLCHAVYKLFGVRKIAISSYHPKWQRWGGVCEPHDGPNAGYAGQRALKQRG